MGVPLEDQLEKLIWRSWMISRPWRFPTWLPGQTVSAFQSGSRSRRRRRHINTDAPSETSGRVPRHDVFSGRHDKFRTPRRAGGHSRIFLRRSAAIRPLLDEVRQSGDNARVIERENGPVAVATR